MAKKTTTRYTTIIFSIIILYLSYLLIKPFIGALLAAVILTYILYPAYSRINKKVKNSTISILLMLLVVIFLLMIPMLIVAVALLDDAINFYNNIRNIDITQIQETIIPLKQQIPIPEDYLLSVLEKFSSGFINVISGFLASIPEKIISSLILIITMLILFKEGKKIIKTLKIIIPLEDFQKDQLFKEFESVTKSVLFSFLIFAIIQGIFTAVTFYIFGISNPLLWGVISSGLSVIPVIGNSPVWVGATIYLFFKYGILRAILFLAVTIAMLNLDNFIIIKVMGEKSRINPVLALIGLIGGLRLFGIVGIILGPLILSLFVSMIGFYTANYRKRLEV